MGKKQHQKDKLYLTTKEWKETYGGHKDDSDTRIQRAQFKRLPFSHCALTFLPFEDPVCSPEGIIFEMSAIIPYLKKHGINPVTGKKMSPKDLIVLHFSKDAQGNFQCPVTYRTFTQTSLIVAIRTTGNVYSMESVEELNLKRNHLKDLLNDEPFQRKDIITLQDPNDLQKFNMETFYHVQFDLKTKAEIAAEKKAMESPSYFINKLNNEAREALTKLERTYTAPKASVSVEQTADTINAAHYSQGKVAQGFTSTYMEPVTVNKAAVLDEDIVKYRRVSKNGYVRIITNHGPLNLELYAKVAPRACENFIVHCKKGYYNGTRFHRLIKHFMIQGGDPTNSGKGGESIWGKPFEDELSGSYRFEGRGVLAMANRGSNTNASQFFITFRSCKHLDGKHTIFGKLVGGMDTLNSMEQVETDFETDIPKDPIYFMAAEVFVDPFEEAAQQVEKERRELKQSEEKLKEKRGTEETLEQKKPKAYSSGVGKYIKPDLKTGIKRTSDEIAANIAPKSIKSVVSGFGDFSKW